MSEKNGHSPKGSSQNLRPSGYVSLWEEVWYGVSGPFYDLLTWWCFLPLGGEKSARRELVHWFEVRPDHKVLSLCCGTGTTERTLIRQVPDAKIIAVDLGAGQIATAKRKDKSGKIDFRAGNASETGLPAAAFDRVLITLALHEMPYELRLEVLREAARVCKPDGRIIAIEHARPESRLSRAIRYLWWFYWLPGNPELPTTMDLQKRGLDNEMREAGIEVVKRHATRPDWIEGVTGRAVPPAPAMVIRE